MNEPPMLFGLSPDPDSPTPTLIPREVAEAIRQRSPAMALALGITDAAMESGVLAPATADIHDFPELRTMGTRVLPGDVPRPVLSTLRQQQAALRAMRRPTMGPRDALALHAQLRTAMTNEGMHKWLGIWLTNYDSERLLEDIDDLPREVEGAGLVWATMTRDMLRDAPTYLVAADANPLITAAAESLPWTMACFPDTPPTADGFLAFAAPYEISDGEQVMRIRSVTWSTAPTNLHEHYDLNGWPPGADDGVLLAFWGEVDDPPPITAEEARKIENVQRRLGTNLVIAQTMPMPLGVPLAEWPLFAALLERGQSEGVTGPIALIMATWMLMKQPIISVGRGSMPPRLRKEIRKAGRIRGDISVINLRQRPPSAERLPADGERVHREYHFRWTVRGHWRHQPVGPGRKEREWIYIFAHVKGPADKPLRQRQRVYRVSGRL